MFLIRILLRLLSDSSYKQMDNEIVQEWLIGLSASDSGFKGYYSIRKRAILGVLGIGVTQKEYWVSLGRLAELKHLSMLSSDLIKKLDKYESSKKREK